jgi:hypothetical protein
LGEATDPNGAAHVVIPTKLNLAVGIWLAVCEDVQALLVTDELGMKGAYR